MFIYLTLLILKDFTVTKSIFLMSSCYYDYPLPYNHLVESSLLPHTYASEVVNFTRPTSNFDVCWAQSSCVCHVSICIFPYFLSVLPLFALFWFCNNLDFSLHFLIMASKPLLVFRFSSAAVCNLYVLTFFAHIRT